MRILVVEDEPAIADFIERGLRAEGYSVSCVHDGAAAQVEALSGDYALVLLDVLLPKQSGLSVLEAIRRQRTDLPVILLTARGEVEHRVEGLDKGANDYVVKPFSFEELMARVRAQLRRPGQPGGTELEVGGIKLDFRTRRVERAGAEVRLTAREFELLAYLMRHPNQVLSRGQILNAVWGFDHEPGTNVIDVYVGYLRRKLRANGTVPIETVRSVGYRLVSEDD
jgi:DNA-binding response OmpR family regulator